MKVIKKASGRQTIKISKSEWENIGEEAGWLKESMIGVWKKIEVTDPRLYSFNVVPRYDPFGVTIKIDFVINYSQLTDREDDEQYENQDELSSLELEMFKKVADLVYQVTGLKVDDYSVFPWDTGFTYSGQSALTDEESDNIANSHSDGVQNPLQTQQEINKTQDVIKKTIDSLKLQGFNYVPSLDIDID